MIDKKTAEKIFNDEAKMKCPCWVSDCEYHGKCRECVALHRYCGKLPTCLECLEETKQ